MTIQRKSSTTSNTKLFFKRVRFAKTSTLESHGFKIPRITTGQGFIILKKAADDNVHFIKPSSKRLHGFNIPTIDTTQRATNAKKSVRFAPQTQTFYFKQNTPKNSLHAASI
jgi:hypothetical protein